MSWRRSSQSGSQGYATPRAGIVMAGQSVRFSAETLALLRRRLKIAAVVSLIVLGAAFIFDLTVRGIMLWPLHVGVLIVFAASYLALRSAREFSAAQLRGIELLLFSAFNVQLIALMTTTVLKVTLQGHPELAISERDFYTGNFSLSIVTYGLLIPNTGKRAAAIILPFALVAYLYPMVLMGMSPRVAAAFHLAPANMFFPTALLASLLAIVGAHTMTTVRRSAFEARRLGQYVLSERIGKGGMGEVYRAEHVLLKRPCAIKLIRPDMSVNERSLGRFEREVKATARLRHWNTVEVFDYGRTDDGTFYYVMELLHGMNLDEMVRGHGPLPPRRVVHFLRQACFALREAHAAGLVHRDIKPANLFCAELGGVYDVVKLLDFGLVRDPDVNEVAQHPQDGACGSPLYMAPEQIADPTATDPRTDLYALGAVGYYLLTGKPPFEKPSKLAVLYAHTNEAVKPPSQHCPAVSPELELIILRCLQKSPDERYQGAADLDHALVNCPGIEPWTENDARTWWESHPVLERAANSAATGLASSSASAGDVQIAGAASA